MRFRRDQDWWFFRFGRLHISKTYRVMFLETGHRWEIERGDAPAYYGLEWRNYHVMWYRAAVVWHGTKWVEK